MSADPIDAALALVNSGATPIAHYSLLTTALSYLKGIDAWLERLDPSEVRPPSLDAFIRLDETAPLDTSRAVHDLLKSDVAEYPSLDDAMAAAYNALQKTCWLIESSLDSLSLSANPLGPVRVSGREIDFSVVGSIIPLRVEFTSVSLAACRCEEHDEVDTMFSASAGAIYFSFGGYEACGQAVLELSARQKAILGSRTASSPSDH